MKLNFIIRGLFLIVLLTAGAKFAAACSCAAPGNVLEAFEESGNVVVLKAVAVEMVGADEKISRVDNVKSTKMVVEKVYKGKLKIGDELIFAQGGGADCVWTFSPESVGSRYLFYLDKGDRTKPYWLGFTCSRSGRIENAAEDLLYLDNLDKVRGSTRISGTLSFAGYRDLTDTPPREGRTIRIAGGGKTYNLKTDKNGVYEIYNLPPGRYQIIPELPKGWKINQFYMSYSDVIRPDLNKDKPLKNFFVNLPPQRHASADFYLEIDNAVRGKVLAPDGTPLRRVCLRLYPPTGISKDFTYLADCVERDEDTFEIDEVPPGRYILVVNDDNEITANEPFPTVYYPGVFELEKAAVINIGIGEFLENIVVTVPRLEKLLTVQGFLRFADGKPAAAESVLFFAAGNNKQYESDARATTDAQGRFTLKILKGMKGRLYGSMYTYLGEYENCPQLDALIRAGGRKNLDAKTPVVELDAESDIFDLELKFPFPDCPKSKN